MYEESCKRGVCRIRSLWEVTDNNSATESSIASITTVLSQEPSARQRFTVEEAPEINTLSASFSDLRICKPEEPKHTSEGSSKDPVSGESSKELSSSRSGSERSGPSRGSASNEPTVNMAKDEDERAAQAEGLEEVSLAFEPHTLHYFPPFKGKEGSDASKWLRQFTYQLGKKPNGQPIPPAQWLYIFDAHLRGNAAVWTKQNITVKEMLSDVYIEDATKEDVKTVKRLFLERFDTTEDLNSTESLHALQTLKQKEGEKLEVYLQRTRSLLEKSGGRDYPENGSVPRPRDTLLPLAVEKFTSGLLDEYLAEKDFLRGNPAKDSLMFTYNLAKERAEHLEKKAARKLAKQFEEKAKLCEEAAVRYIKDGRVPQSVQEALVGMKGLDITEEDFRRQKATAAIAREERKGRGPPQPRQPPQPPTSQPPASGNIQQAAHRSTRRY